MHVILSTRKTSLEIHIANSFRTDLGIATIVYLCHFKTSMITHLSHLGTALIIWLCHIGTAVIIYLCHLRIAMIYVSTLINASIILLVTISLHQNYWSIFFDLRFRSLSGSVWSILGSSQISNQRKKKFQVRVNENIFVVCGSVFGWTLIRIFGFGLRL